MEKTVSTRRVLRASVAELWEVVDDTSRYADWVDGCLAVTRHHGRAVVGRTYEERNRTVGPLTTRSVWTVREIVPHELRVDTGTGFDPLQDMVNTFRFAARPDGATEMTYECRFRIGLGPAGRVLGAVLGRSLELEFQRSMQKLQDVVVSERSLP